MGDIDVLLGLRDSICAYDGKRAVEAERIDRILVGQQVNEQTYQQSTHGTHHENAEDPGHDFDKTVVAVHCVILLCLKN